MMDYFLFQPVSTTSIIDGSMRYPVCMMVHIKYPLLLIRKIRPSSGGSEFPLYLNGPLPCVQHQMKHFHPSFVP